MSFKSEVTCDGNRCYSTFELDTNDPAQAEIEYYALQDRGWLIAFNDDSDYCPKCKPIVLAEMEDEANNVESGE